MGSRLLFLFLHKTWHRHLSRLMHWPSLDPYHQHHREEVSLPTKQSRRLCHVAATDAGSRNKRIDCLKHQSSIWGPDEQKFGEKRRTRKYNQHWDGEVGTRMPDMRGGSLQYLGGPHQQTCGWPWNAPAPRQVSLGHPTMTNQEDIGVPFGHGDY